MTFKAFKAEIQHICPTSLRYVSSAIKSVSFCSSVLFLLLLISLCSDPTRACRSGTRPSLRASAMSRSGLSICCSSACSVLVSNPYCSHSCLCLHKEWWRVGVEWVQILAFPLPWMSCVTFNNVFLSSALWLTYRMGPIMLVLQGCWENEIR